MPISLYKGKIKNAWFNVFDYLTSDDQGICNAAKFVHNLIELEVMSGTSLNKIILSGHSQGGALALYAGLTYTPKKKRSLPSPDNSDNDDSQRLGAVVAFNAWLPLRHKFCGLCKDFWYPNKECNLRTSKERTGPINILQIHGLLDHIVPITWAQRTQHIIQHYCSEYELKSYTRTWHQVLEPQLSDFKMFCLSLLRSG